MKTQKGCSPSNYHFDDVVIERDKFRLRKGEQQKSLTPRAFDLLLYLIEHRGRVVEKQELFERIWQGTFVTDNALTREIKEIRRVLGDDAAAPRYIETVHKRGYRFIADLRAVTGAQHTVPVERHDLEIQSGSQAGGEVMLAEAGIDSGGAPAHSATAPVAAALPQPQLDSRRFVWPAALLGLTLVVIAAIWLIVLRPTPETPAPPPRIIPFTSFQGREFHPAFSPDGNQVAFVWDGEKGDNLDIYVKLIDAETPVRLTSNPADDINPVWSPDGRRIAFVRLASDNGEVFVVPATGGPERKLHSANSGLDPFGFAWRPIVLAWSPDGWLAVPNKASPEEPISIFLLSIETGARRRLTSPPATSLGDMAPAFSPDGKMLAFARSRTPVTQELYVVPVMGGEPRRLKFNDWAILNLVWTSDGRDIVFSSAGDRGAFSLWRVSVSGGQPTLLAAAGRRGLFDPAISRQGRLAYTQVIRDVNIWRTEVATSTGRGASPAKLSFSTRAEFAPKFSPDGKRIVLSSTRSGNGEIWTCDPEGKNPVQLTTFGDSSAGSPRWSPDGERVAFDYHADIFVISAEGGFPRRLTTETSDEVLPSWSRDGRWIYFGSNRGGAWRVWRMPVEGGTAGRLTTQGGSEAFESPDGKFVYYSRREGGIWRVPVEGGEEVLILDKVMGGDWAVTDKGIYFISRQASSRATIAFFNLTMRRVTPIAPIAKESAGGLAVSRDGRWIVYAQVDQVDSDIMMMEPFR